MGRELDAVASKSAMMPTPDFTDRVMAAVAAEPPPRPVAAFGAAVMAVSLRRTLGAIGDAWRVALSGARPPVDPGPGTRARARRRDRRARCRVGGRRGRVGPVRAGAIGRAAVARAVDGRPDAGPRVAHAERDALAHDDRGTDRHAGADRDREPDRRPRRQLGTGRRRRQRRVRRWRIRLRRQRQRQERRRRRRGEHAPPDVNPVLDRRPRRRQLRSRRWRRKRRRLEPRRLGQRRVDRVLRDSRPVRVAGRQRKNVLTCPVRLDERWPARSRCLSSNRAAGDRRLRTRIRECPSAASLPDATTCPSGLERPRSRRVDAELQWRRTSENRTERRRVRPRLPDHGRAAVIAVSTSHGSTTMMNVESAAREAADFGRVRRRQVGSGARARRERRRDAASRLRRREQPARLRGSRTVTRANGCDNPSFAYCVTPVDGGPCDLLRGRLGRLR